MGLKKIQTEVRNGEYKITTNPLESLFTKDLDSCIGLALVENIETSRKRGLAHYHYSGDMKYLPGDGDFVLLDEDVSRADEFMKEFLGKFSNPYAFLICNRFNLNKAQEYENLMFTYVKKILGNNGIEVRLEDKNKSIKKGGNVSEILYKDIVLHNSKIHVLYKDSSDKILNNTLGLGSGEILESEEKVFPYVGIRLD